MSESIIILATILVIMSVPESKCNWLGNDDDAAGGLNGDDIATEGLYCEKIKKIEINYFEELTVDELL
nr:unnamed protein product [Haemonchus contortus]